MPPIIAMPPVAMFATAALPVAVEAPELVEEVPDEEPVEVWEPDDVLSVVESVRFELDTDVTVVLALEEVLTTVLVEESEALVETAELLV